MIDRACISLGEKCNLKCKYCHFRGKLSKTPQEFTFDELTEIIENIYRYSNQNSIEQFKIGIVGSGEPLLEFEKIKKLVEYVRIQNYSNISFYTITNGTVLRDEMFDFFYSNQDTISLCFSLDGYEELHNAGRGNFKKTYENIKKYENLFGHKPPINCTVHKLTFQNAEKVKSFFINENFKEVTFSRLFDSKYKNLTISEKEYFEFIKIFEKCSFTVRQLNKENIKKYDCKMYGRLCGVGKTNIFFTKLGIYPCGRFYGNKNYVLGSFNTNLNEIQTQMEKMRPLCGGECYYDKYILGIV